MTAENIHQAIANIYSKVGYVQKERKQGLNYSFAGEVALIQALRPAMVEEQVYLHLVSGSVVSQETYTTAKGGVMNSTTIEGQVRFTHAPSGTFIDVWAVGTGADSGDKASPKSLTGLYKYALRQTFCIETGDDPDMHSSDDQERASGRKLADKVQDIVPGAKKIEKEQAVPSWYQLYITGIREHGVTKEQVAGYFGEPEFRGSLVQDWVEKFDGEESEAIKALLSNVINTQVAA